LRHSSSYIRFKPHLDAPLSASALRWSTLILGREFSIPAASTGPKRSYCLGPRGAVAQLGERLVRNEEASGSIPLSSTIFVAIGLRELADYQFMEERLFKSALRNKIYNALASIKMREELFFRPAHFFQFE
jgi:hypothetical protein